MSDSTIKCAKRVLTPHPTIHLVGGNETRKRALTPLAKIGFDFWKERQLDSRSQFTIRNSPIFVYTQITIKAEDSMNSIGFDNEGETRVLRRKSNQLFKQLNNSCLTPTLTPTQACLTPTHA